MTYKSIDTILGELRDHRGSGGPKLIAVLPSEFDPDDSDVREMLMPPHLWKELSKNNPKKTRDYNANVRAFLLRFVCGGGVDNETYMKSWRDDIFELRVQLARKDEALRIFGGFAKEDTFIALIAKPRSYFDGKDDPRWDEIIDRAIIKWNEYLPGKHRVPARPFSNCVSSNAYDVHGG